MTNQAVLVDVKNGVATITMNVPQRMNSLVPEITQGLREATEKVKHDNEVKAVILTGSGKAFCAGGDISSFIGDLTVTDAVQDFYTVHSWVDEFYRLPKPTIAAVNGFAVGAGFSVALICDVVFSAESAKFGLSFANVGLVPDYSLGYFLPRSIGVHRAKDLFFTARNISAKEAMDLGIVNAVLPDDGLMDHATGYAQRLAQGPSLAYAFGKRMLNESMDQDFKTFLTSEAHAQSILLNSADAKEAADAFLNKRKPQFKSR